MDSVTYTILIHAGTTESWSGDAGYQKETEQVLFGIAKKAGSMLASGVKSVDVVEYAVSELEDCPLFNAGKGAALNEKGKHELEAGIVDGSTGAYGAVACADTIKNPVRAARLVLGTNRHCLLIGAAAVDVASRSGLSIVSNDYFTTAARLAHWKAQANQQAKPSGDLETVGAVALDRYGRLAAAGSTGGLTNKSMGRIGDTAVIGAGLLAEKDIAVVCLLSAGLTRYPTSTGHTLLTIHHALPLMSLQLPQFVEVLTTARQLSSSVCSSAGASRCGLVCDGSSILSLIPLLGLSKDWEPVINEEEEFHASFPGFLTSKNGPKLNDSELTATQAKILSSTSLKEPYDYSFSGPIGDQNLFARLVRGEVPQWRIWEDKKHVTFLTPFGNTPGYTVLIPRKHLSSDVFSLDDHDYKDIITAAYRVAQHLKHAFEIAQCGMFFEGYEIDYAHVKLVPVHAHSVANGRPFIPLPGSITFQEKYEGFLTSQSGPLTRDLGKLAEKANSLRKLQESPDPLTPPGSWSRAESHSMEAVQSAWYTTMLTVQDSFYHASIDFFHRLLGYTYALVPQTTDSISSPMGLGSDSQPVRISLHGQDTFLADSMQFTLEYALRLKEGLKGTYYVGCSFRGEDHDQTHLNQFHHIECELLGDLNDGIDVAEAYIMNLASVLLESHGDLIEETAGNTKHITDLLELYNSGGRKLPRITLDQALGMAEIQSTSGAWEYAVADDPSRGRVLTRIGERTLITIFGGAVWLMEMDHLSVPFYQAFVPGKQQSKALCADLLIGPGEVLGLGQRHVDVQSVKDALKMHEVSEDNYRWYMDIRDEAKGGKPLLTTGWGMGMERFLCWLMGHDDVRDMAIIPRLKGLRFQP
ncbi:MAG: hypothetical protein Q9216_001492 [Gyalolechia sp. 2 TL-2023]